MNYVELLARRVDAIERRLIALAIATGHPELALPFPNPAMHPIEQLRQLIDDRFDCLDADFRETIASQRAVLDKIAAAVTDDSVQRQSPKVAS